MRLAVIVGTDEIKRMRSALKFANVATKDGNDVKLFILGECFEDKVLDAEEYHLRDGFEEFLGGGGQVYTCGTCVVVKKFFEGGEEGVCPLCTMEDLYKIVKWADKIVYF